MRIEGWEQRLHDHIQQGRSITFQWGENDCALWSADWASKATGKDFVSQWRGKYHTEAGLQEIMLERGFATPSDIADEALAPVGLPFTQRGDIVLHPQGCLGVCDGIVSYFLMEKGITRLHTASCVKAWKVD
jgi:hypothetical protein